MNLNDLIKAADTLGEQDGRDAASWYFTGSEDRDQYQQVLKGIEDGDPAILDTLPGSPLSGEFAGDMAPNALYEQLGVTELQLRNWEQSDELDQLCTAYEEGFSTGVGDEITRQCRIMLEQDVTFTISVKTEQDPEKLLGMLTDLLARENCDLNDDSYELD